MKDFDINNIIQYAKNAPDFLTTIKTILQGIKAYTTFQCVGIRIKDSLGDYPYFIYDGFSKEFVEKENLLCQFNDDKNIKRDKNGNLILACMCGNILQGRINPDFPFFTPGGSFWTNSTTKLLATTTAKERQSETRNTCNIEGYESLGLFPMKYGSIVIGLLQLADSRKDMFSDEKIQKYELCARQIAHLIYHSMFFKTFKEKI